MEESKYYRFPVALLAGNTEELYGRIIAYCVGDCAINVASNMTNTEQIASEVLENEGYGYSLDDIDPDDYEEEVNCLVAARILGVNLGGTVDVRRYRSAFYSCPKSFGKMFVVFPRDPFWGFKNADSDDETRKFLILCGVLAGIGDAAYKKLQYERIGAIASGYSSADELKRFNSKPRFTREQVRWTVDKLEQIRFGETGQNGWFVRCPLNRRHMYYSKKLNLAQLQAELVKIGVAKRKAPMRDRATSVQQMINTEMERQNLIEKMRSGGLS